MWRRENCWRCGLYALKGALCGLRYDAETVELYNRRRYKRKARISWALGEHDSFTKAGKERDDDTYFHVNSASPVSTARVIRSSHNVASSGGSGSKLDVENPSSSSSKKLSSTFARSAAEMSGL